MTQLNDPKRLASLHATRLLDAESSEAFERLTRLAARLLGTSVAAITLIDEDRQVLLAATGLGDDFEKMRQLPLSHSFCKHVVETEAPLRVGAAREHPLVHDNPAINDHGVEAYLGVPLVTPDGDVLGALCAVDGASHHWSDDDLRVLGDLSSMVMSEVRSRATSRALAGVNDRLRRLADAAFEAIAISAQGAIVDANDSFCQLFGYSHEEVVGMRAEVFVPASERTRVTTAHRTGHENIYETTGLRADGTTFPVEVRGRMMEWDGRTVRVTAVHDLTERVAAEQQRRLHSEILTNMAEGVCTVRASDATILYTNPTFDSLYGYEPGDMVGRSIHVLRPADPLDLHDAALREQIYRLQEGDRVQLELRNQRKDGLPIWCRVTASAMNDRIHGLVRVAVHEDISESKREGAALARQTLFVDLLRATATEANEAEQSAAAIQAVLQRVAQVMNWPVGHAYRVLSTPDGLRLQSTDLWHLSDPEVLEGFWSATAATPVAPGAGLAGRVLATGRAQWIDDIASDPTFPHRDAAEAGGLHGGLAFPVQLGAEIVAVLEFYSSRVEEPDEPLLDVVANVGTMLGRVVERERSRAMLEQRAAEVRALSLRDELTGLHNRRGFLELARLGVRLADRSQRPALVIFIDLNGMKPINDRHGHEAGDNALCAAASVLRATFRDSDVIARLGGDEFAVFAPDVANEQGRLFLERLRANVQFFNDTPDDNRPWHLSLSSGVSTYNPHERRSIEDVLEEADARMYEAKRNRARTGESVPPPPSATAIPVARPSTSPFSVPRPSTSPRR